jgi:capsular polysaccharide biosynthesis protein
MENFSAQPHPILKIRPYIFPVFGRCPGTMSLEKLDPTQQLRHGIDKTVVLHQDDVGRNLQAASSEPAPPSRGPYPRKLYVSQLADAFATHQGAYITRDSQLIEEFSQYFDQPIEKHRYLRSLRLLRKIKKIDRPVFALTGAGQYNYHHWWLDILPKFHLIQAYADVPSDVLYYVEISKPFQLETLRYLGLPPESLLNSRQTQIIQARHMMAASPRSPTQKPDPWTLAWVRKTFSPMAQPHPDRPNCVLISRKQAKTRSIVNEDEIMKCLAPLNPIVIELEKLTVAEQIGLFAGAKQIIAPHGAGLTNLIFAPRDCRIIELFGASRINDCYRYLAEGIGCPYTPLLGEDVVDPQTGETNIRASIASLKAELF